VRAFIPRGLGEGCGLPPAVIAVVVRARGGSTGSVMWQRRLWQVALVCGQGQVEIPVVRLASRGRVCVFRLNSVVETGPEGVELEFKGLCLCAGSLTTFLCRSRRCGALGQTGGWGRHEQRASPAESELD